jgi:hypothetical protein
MTLKRLGQPPLSEKMYDLPANGIITEAVTHNENSLGQIHALVVFGVRFRLMESMKWLVDAVDWLLA